MPKKSTGSIRKLPSGTWRGQLMDGYKQDGSKNIINFSAPTKGEVQDKIREYLNLKDAHVHPNKSVTVSEWSDTWYQDYKTQVQPSTYSGYKYTLKIIKDYFLNEKLSDIAPININRFQDELITRGYGISQLKKCRSMLVQIFDFGEENGLILNNPVRKAKPIRDVDGMLSQPRYVKDAFNEAEWAALHERLPNSMMGNSIIVLLESGLRVQELLALTPDDIAEDGSMIKVNKAIKTVNGIPTLGPPKSKRSNRDVPLPISAWSSARYLRESGGKTLIWSMPGKNPCYSVGSFRRRYYNALKEVGGVRLLSPHCCRHTYVTRLQANGIPLELISKLVGHFDVSTTEGYAHTGVETLRLAVEALQRKGGNDG